MPRRYDCKGSGCPEHTIFQCPRWELLKIESNKETGKEATPENLVSCMRESPKNWDVWRSVIDGVHRKGGKTGKELVKRKANWHPRNVIKSVVFSRSGR